ncbi:MAG TPA: ATP-binding protein [Gemmatimonas sp.]|nr:ATP-binding protein [Gemmatimonas sp.]
METIARAGPARVVLTGSESVGKTTLAAALAAHYHVRFVPEFVREYASAKGAPLDFRDHGPIAKGQMRLEDEYMAQARTDGALLMIGDTDLTSTVVYCHHYFGQCPAFIEEAAVARAPDLYLLLDIDVPWTADGVRDRGDRREELHGLFVAVLERSPAPVLTISGDWSTRFSAAVRAIDALLLSFPTSCTDQ